MKKTERFGLCQWDASDRIRMEDFNADNAALESALAENANALTQTNQDLSALEGQLGKLETALGGKNGGFVKIRDWVDGGGMSILGAVFDLDMDWNMWDVVVVSLDMGTTPFTAEDKMTIKTSMTGSVLGQPVYVPAGSFTLVFFPFRNKTNPVQGVYIGTGGSTMVLLNQTFENVIGMVMELEWPSTTKFAKNRIRVYGM